MSKELSNINEKLSKAVKFFWDTRRLQKNKQKTSVSLDKGSRSSVTGGAQMDGFNRLIMDLIIGAGIEKNCVYYKKSLELPGYFRPEKKWDILIVKEGQLLAAIEAKSQVGPSFGNNFNNRSEEAIGSAVDLWTAYREGIFNKTVKPLLGYIFLLEDCEKSNSPVSLREPHFEVFKEFKNASYGKRYEILCRKLIRERHYSATCFITSNKKDGIKGKYSEPAKDLTFNLFAKSLLGHLTAYM